MREQFLYYLSAVLLLPFFPILAWQGYRLRKQIPRLPEADGPFEGKIEEQPPPIRILGLGESTFAGVGVATQEEGITFHIAKTLQNKTDRSVYWQVLARSGYTARSVHDRLVPQLPDTAFDFIVIGLGGNETFTLNRPLRWRQQLKQLILALKEQQPDSQIIIANMPAVGHFPAFPKSFQWILGGLVELHRCVIMDLPGELPDTYYMSEKVSWEEWEKYLENGQTKADFYSDGVHPSALTYRIWGEQIGAFIYTLALKNAKKS